MSVKTFEWLEGIGLSQYATAFEENDIGWELLGDIDQETLKDIGVGSAGHRLQILKAAKSIHPEQIISTIATADTQPPKSVNNAMDGEGASVWTRTPGERKPVTMLFADIVSSTALTEKLDAEDAHDLLYQATQLMCQSVENNKGTVCRFMGDGIMAMFGAPVASERHALEACHAALEMQASVDNYSSELESSHAAGIQIRIGLHSGEVIVLEVGDDPDKPEYDASGPTVPMAARLEQSAEAGTIQISEQTRSLAGNLIETKEIPAILVKGISDPVVVHRLQNVISAAALVSGTVREAIAGRKSELAQFGSLLEACMESGHGQTIFVRGEAGIGKTRLVEEMTYLAKERGFNSHKALVLDFGAGKGQEAVPSLVRSLIGIAQGSGKSERETALDQAENDRIVKHDNRVFLNDLLDLKQPLELRTLYDAMAPQMRKEGKRLSVMKMVAKLSTRKPVFIVVEDLHWADDITLDYLAKLATTVAECPALMVFTSRAEGDPIDTTWRARAGEPSIVTWDLSPLRIEESMTLVSGLADASDSIVKRCIDRAAGNPLFLKQLLLSVEKGTSENVPDSIKSLVLARMDQLASNDKHALQAAAVLGQRFELECLRYLTNSPDYDCQVLVERHLIRPEGPLYLFAHALIQEGAYSSLLKQQRVEWHHLAAEWYARRDLILHAEHLDHAGDNLAASAYYQAAREQFTQFRPERALQLVRVGLNIAPASQSFDLKSLEGELLRVLGLASESIATCRDALEVAVDGIQSCLAWLGVAEGLEITGEHEELIKVLMEAEDIAKSHDLILELGRIFRLRAGVLFFKSENDACLEASYAALKYAREASSLEMEARALSVMGDAEYNRGRFESAYRYFDQCIELAREHGFGRVIAANLPMRGYLSHFRNDVEAKIADYHEAVDLAAKTRDLRAELMALTGGIFWAEMGDFDKGREWLERGLAVTNRLGSKLFQGEFLFLFARLAVMQGDNELAREHAQNALSVLRKAESGMTFRGPTALGVIALTVEEPDQRRSFLQEAETLLSGDSLDHNYLDFYEDAIQACLLRGDWDEVDRYANALMDYTAAEPIPRCSLSVARGHVLADYGRGIRGPDTVAELHRVYEETARVGLKFMLPELEAAIQST
jgi:class 3 adenylate cyclase/tetratricopeptide (TPR) repeat protein